MHRARQGIGCLQVLLPVHRAGQGAGGGAPLSTLAARVRDALAPDGALARARDDLNPRAGQLEMALAVAQAMEAGERLVVEAGTGVGKTFAYLVPLLLGGQRALLSTATQALQDQLFGRDIPAVCQALGLPVRAALLKGRSSYACLHRLEQALQDSGPGRRDPAVVAVLAQVLRWAQGSRSGDLAELSGLDERSPLRPIISSTRENCLGSACPRVADCHVNRARREALQADWVVINHHLFLADQRVRDPDLTELLPAADVVVFDEAHQLADMVIQFLGQAIGSAQLHHLARDLSAQGALRARGMRPWHDLALRIDQAVNAVSQLPSTPSGGPLRSRWLGRCPQGVAIGDWVRSVHAVDQALSATCDALAANSGAAVELQQLLERAKALGAGWRLLTEPGAAEPDAGLVRWLEWGPGGAAARPWRLAQAPGDGSPLFRSLLEPEPGRARSWVFTSATLGSDASLSWFTQRLGLQALDRLRILRVPSPFDHAAQAALYVPHDLPEPSEPEHTLLLADRVARWASRLGGRTLVLTTTLRAASRMAGRLQALIAEGLCAPLQVLAQGQLSKRTLLARFRAAGQARTAAPDASAGAVLVASMSFWEGVDLAGDVLQLLVIDKLPFPPPDDPFIQARAQALEAKGQSAFNGCYLPETAMSLKQGVGRLIRSASDQGVLVIADRRLLTRSYGNRLLAELPAMHRLADEAQMQAALDALVITRLSTKDRYAA